MEALGTMATLSHNPSGYNHNYQEVSISVLGQYFYSYCRRRTHLLVVFGIPVSQSRKVAHLEKFTATSILSETKKTTKKKHVLFCFYGFVLNPSRVGLYSMLPLQPTHRRHWCVTLFCSETAMAPGLLKQCIIKG